MSLCVFFSDSKTQKKNPVQTFFDEVGIFILILLSSLFLQRFFRTGFDAFKAQNAFRTILAFAGVVRHIDVHRTDCFAFAARNAFRMIARNSKERKVTHRFEENCNGTNVLAESPVIFKGIGKDDPDRIIHQVADDECPEHDPFDVSDMSEEECRHKNE